MYGAGSESNEPVYSPGRDSSSDSLSPEEMLSQLLIHWSAKETLYKVLGCQEVDFVEH